MLKYNWQRYLCERDKSYSVDADGFLQSYSNLSDFKAYQPNLNQISEFRASDCVVVLGEPGIGKSSVLKDEYTSHSSSEASDDNIYLYKNLNTYSTDSTLIEDIFNCSEILEWKQSSRKRLCLYLDSLDEALINVNTVAQIISEKLQNLPLSRMYLKISCRTGVWPLFLESALSSCFKNDFHVLELVQLSRSDIEEACKKEGLDAADFIESIIQKGIVPLAVKPNTLNFLLMSYKDNGSFPSKRTDLYEIGCKLHCRELNKSYNASNQSSLLDVTEKIDIASRIASAMIFCNKSVIYIGNDISVEENNISFEDIVFKSSNGNIEINESHIKETLKTGLFVSRGVNKMGWAHQSYAEFLSARYIYNNNLNQKQINSLFFDSSSHLKKLIPTLYQTAVWYSFFSDAFFNEMMQSDPEVVLRSDLSQTTKEIKQVLLENIISNLERENTLITHDFELRRRFKSLKFEGMNILLQPIFNDCDANDDLKRFVIDLVVECKITDFYSELVNIVLNKKEDEQHRIKAASAISQVGEPSHKKSLINILNEENDERDELKGYALTSLWPDGIGIEDLLSNLSPPKRSHYFGSYGSFLSYNFVQFLKKEHLIPSLKWCLIYCDNSDETRISSAIDEIIKKAFNFLEDNNILVALTPVLIKRLSNHLDILKRDQENSLEKFDRNTKAREKILTIHFKNNSIVEIDKVHVFSVIPLATGLDIEYLIELFKSQDTTKKKQRIATLIRLVVDFRQDENLNIILQYYNIYKELKDEFLWQLGPIDLKSDIAKTMKENFTQEKKYAPKKKKEVNWDRIIKTYITKSYKALESNNTNAFYNIMRYICVDLSNGEERDDILDIEDGDGWKFITTALQSQLISSGKIFLEEFSHDISKSYVDNSYNRVVMTGLKFLRLLYKYDKDYLENMGTALWEKWTPPLLLYPTWSNYDDETHFNILTLSSQKSTDVFIKTLHKILYHEIKSKDGHIFILGKIKKLMSLDLATSLHSYLSSISNDLSTEKYIYALGKFLEFGVTNVEEELKDLFYPPCDYPEQSRKIAALAISTLFTKSKSGGWKYIYPCLKYDLSFGREVFLQQKIGSFGLQGVEILSKLSDLELSEFYIWMIEAFPYKEDNHEGSGRVSPKEEAQNLRATALNALINRGTDESCYGITKAIQCFPEHKFLKRCLLEAEKRKRVVQWQPPTPTQILIFCQNNKNRFINNCEDLSLCVIDSLQRFEEMLHGETPAIADIWNTDRKRPMSEDEFSDRVKRFLKEELISSGVIVNREVEIRRHPEGARTDIYISAVTQNKSGDIDQIHLVIESKGDWNDGVYDSMEDQLVSKYLVNHATTNGIYLIANFYCEEWDENDYRKAKARNNDLASNDFKLMMQADELKEEGYQIFPFVMNTKFRK